MYSAKQNDNQRTLADDSFDIGCHRQVAVTGIQAQEKEDKKGAESTVHVVFVTRLHLRPKRSPR